MRVDKDDILPTHKNISLEDNESARSKAQGINLIDEPNNEGITPLMAASNQGHIEIVKFLISKGANIKAKSPEGKTAYDYAANNEIKIILKNAAKLWRRASCWAIKITDEENQSREVGKLNRSI